MQLTDLQLNRQLYKTPPQTTETLPADDVAANLSPAPSTNIASGNSVTDINTNAEQLNGDTIAPGTIPPSTLDIANFGWTQTCAFTVTDSDTIAWGAGTFTSADGVNTHSIGAGNTGNMGASPARTYVYLDINVSLTAYQVSTSITAPVGVGKVLIAVCQAAIAPSTTATYALVQATQIVGDNVIANTISAEKMNVAILSAITADLGSITAGTITVVGGGNTVSFTPALTTVMVSGPTGSPTFSLTAAGQLTVIGMSSLNKKAYTNFESIGRFVTSGGDVLPVFGNQGMTIAPSAVASHYCRNLWDISNVFTNNPTFVVTLIVGTTGSGDSRGFIGMGLPTVSGSGIVYTAIDHIGFTINKTSGTVDVGGQNGDASGNVGANFTTVVTGDKLELFVKVTATAVFYYYRKNGGALTLGTTQTTHIPTAAGEIYISFMNSNAGSAVDFPLIIQCAAYEH